jgi:hypothetical protein
MRLHRLLMLVVAVVVLPALGAADDFSLTGVGGGGYLASGAIHPSDSTLIVIGADVSGVYRSYDFGGEWAPWNEGIPDGDESLNSYVEDLLGVDYEGWSGFYAATYGGIYRATVTGDWECMTPVPSYSYKDDLARHAVAIPFSCLDWNGEGLIVAGAGCVRWGTNSEAYNYPGLPALRFKQSYGDYDGQWTIWTLDLNDSVMAWAPDESTTFGAARDVSVAVLGGDTYIAAATPEGIYVKDDVGWRSVCDSLYEEGLTCWSIHLTKRGTLYAAMEKESGSLSSGAYRLFDVNTSSFWAWVGDDTQLPPKYWPLETIGMDDQLVFMSVVDGDSNDPDLLYLGHDNGLFRTYQPYDAEELCTWQHKIFRHCGEDTCHYHYIDGNGYEQDLDIGWETEYGAPLNFHPVVSQVYGNRVAVQLSGRMHVSTDCGDSWQQSYVDTVGGYWKTRGYNELFALDLAFMSGRRAVQSTGDHGVFRSSDASLETWERLHPEVDTAATPTDDIAWTHETASVGVHNDTLYVVSGDLCQLAAPCKLFMVDDQGTWHNITDSLNSDRYHFWDFTFTDDDACFMAYTKYDRKAGTIGARVDEIGVFKGTRDANGWSWATWNDGLCALSYPESVNARGAELLYHPMSGRLFMAARYAVTKLASYNTVDLYGGLYMLPSSESTTWQLEFGGDSNYSDFRCLAKSADDSVIYAGTRGRSWPGIGTVLKCENPWATPTTWTPLANTAETGYPFEFEVPFWATEVPLWDTNLANKHLTDIRALAVNPWDRDIVYAGMHCEGFMEKEGLWKYDAESGWDHLSEGEPFVGIGVFSIAIKKKFSQAKLVIGTAGQEVYYTTLQKPMDPPPQQWATLSGPGLKILFVRPLTAGRAVEINFSLSRPSPIKMEIFDVTGRTVTGHDTGLHEAGACRLVWDCRTAHGRLCAPGVYFLRLRARKETVDKKFVVLR